MLALVEFTGNKDSNYWETNTKENVTVQYLHSYEPKCILTIKTRFASFYRYRGTPQGSVQARTLTRCSRKSPSVMAFWLVCLGILKYSCQNTSRDSGY